jgi:hypothetical protein
VLDEVRLEEPVNVSMRLMIGQWYFPHKLNFVNGIARINPPLCFDCLRYQTIQLETGEPAQWVVGLLSSANRQFVPNTYFVEDYDQSDKVGVFTHGGVFTPLQKHM